MAFVDKLKAPMRGLVHAYGVEMIQGMILDGHRDPDTMRDEIEAGAPARQARYDVTCTIR